VFLTESSYVHLLTILLISVAFLPLLIPGHVHCLIVIEWMTIIMPLTTLYIHHLYICLTQSVSLTSFTLPSLFVGSFFSPSDQTPAFPFVSLVPLIVALHCTYCIILSLRLYLSLPHSTIL